MDSPFWENVPAYRWLEGKRFRFGEPSDIVAQLSKLMAEEENAIAAQFRHVAGVLPQCRNRAAWRTSKQWMPPSAACSGLPLALRRALAVREGRASARGGAPRKTCHRLQSFYLLR